jgi:hypothetical protein
MIWTGYGRSKETKRVRVARAALYLCCFEMRLRVGTSTCPVFQVNYRLGWICDFANITTCGRSGLFATQLILRLKRHICVCTRCESPSLGFIPKALGRGMAALIRTFLPQRSVDGPSTRWHACDRQSNISHPVHQTGPGWGALLAYVVRYSVYMAVS